MAVLRHWPADPAQAEIQLGAIREASSFWPALLASTLSTPGV